MNRFKLRDRLVIQFLIINFTIVSITGLFLLFQIDNYKAAMITLAILLATTPITFLASWIMSSRISKKLNNINKAILSLKDENYQFKNVKAIDEIDQIYNNISYIAQILRDFHQFESREIENNKAILNNLTVGILVIDTNGEIIYGNNKIKTIFNLKKITGKQTIEAFQNHELAKLVDKAMLGKKTESKIDISAPKLKSLSILALPLNNNSETVKGCSLIIEDSTVIDRLANVKKDLVANVSHELRTPIATIKTLTEALSASKLENNKTNREFLKDIDYETNRLSLLVRDVLDLSKIESKKKRKLSKTSISKILDDVTLSYKKKIKDKGISLDVKVKGNLPMVKADKEQLQKAFSNLLDNAHKFTPKGGSITINSSAANGAINILFKDNGQGIKQKEIDRIFERFYMGSKNRSDVPGTGLGLAIVKHAIEEHDGSIKVSSSWGKGSQFEINLPYK